ncbi:MAG: amidase [Pseudomonadota bacterium]
MTFEIEETTIGHIHAAYRDGTLSCVELTQGYLDRIAALDKAGPELNAFVTMNPAALERAAELDRAYAETGSFVGPLHGIPIGVKDQAETAGLETSFGSAALKGYVPAEDATIITKLHEAGAILLGKLTMPDFAASWWGYGSVHGITRCPYALDRDSGGSSGGTGSAVAANLVAVGIGEDTGGSIRLPSSINNLCGIRVTPGMISRSGLSPLLVPLDTAGPMGRTVRDIATMLDVLVGYDPKDAYTSVTKIAGHTGSYTDHLDPDALEGARFGTIVEAYGDEANPDCAQVNKVIRAAIDALKGAGAEVVELSIPNLVDWIGDTSLYVSRSRNDVDTFLQSRPLPYATIRSIYEADLYDKNLDLIPILAKDAPETPEEDPDYHAKVVRGVEFQRLIVALMAEHGLDGICYPSLQIQSPPHDELQRGMWPALTYPTNTVIASQSLIPAISVPAGFTDIGLPVGLEIIAPPHHEPDLLRLGYAFEQLTKWRRKPDL